MKAAKYDDALLLDAGEGVQRGSIEGAITVRDLTKPQTVQIEKGGIYQADAYLLSAAEKTFKPDGSKLREDLIGVWSLDGDARSRLGEKELVGQPVGEAKFVDSPFGKAISVDGKTGAVVVPRDDAMNVGEGEFTVAAWIYPTELRQAGIVCLGGYGYAHGWLFDMPGGNGVLRIETANAGGQHNGTVQSRPGVIRRNRWQHVAVSVRRGENNTRLYVNGYQVGVGTIGGWNLDNPKVSLHIGRIQNANLFAGQIDDVRYYRRALDEAEIDALVEPGQKFADPPPAAKSASFVAQVR